jgi:SAM-dependent methyltransferase
MEHSQAWKFTQPIDFDVDLYRNAYADLSGLSDSDLKDHYVTYGKLEGRIGTPFAKRERFLELAEGAKSILEIGPGHKPCFRGDNVKYFDILDAGELKERATLKTDESLDRLVDCVHFVDKNGDLTTVKDRFDVIFSSHNIEHQVNLIKHLNDVFKLLNDGGAFLGIMPDRRYCFDRNIPASTIGDILQAYFDNHTRHKISDIIDQYAISAHNNPQHHWQHPQAPELHIDFPMLKQGVDNCKSSEYIDVHAWRFSFLEFEKYIRACIDLGYLDFNKFVVYPTEYLSNEFCFFFYK